jgi:hypothetical protein
VRAILLALALIGAASCGGKVAVDRGDLAGGTGGAGSGDCGDNGLPVPATYKGCTYDAECTIAFLIVDCCYGQAAVGVAVPLLQAFASYKEQCDTIEPVCACDPGPLQAEDGNATTEASALHAACLDGVCSTYVE